MRRLKKNILLVLLTESTKAFESVKAIDYSWRIMNDALIGEEFSRTMEKMPGRRKIGVSNDHWQKSAKCVKYHVFDQSLVLQW